MQIDEIKTSILKTIKEDSRDVVIKTANKYGITRQGVNKHAQRLVDLGFISIEGKTKAAKYKIIYKEVFNRNFQLNENTSESDIWANNIAQNYKNLPKNVYEVWHHGFTEMFNNVIDHSESTEAIVTVKISAIDAIIHIIDSGVGIFKKIKTAKNFSNLQHSILELAKGKFTTNPSKHSGEGIFFTSKAFDKFSIISDNITFEHFHDSKKNVIADVNSTAGTYVIMEMFHDSKILLSDIFDKYATPDSYKFDKTVVPVCLAQMGDDNLVSRSQAKRLLSRFEMFRLVNLDFSGVETIGQAFADEIFRVFKKQHPEVDIIPTMMEKRVEMMVKRALNH